MESFPIYTIRFDRWEFQIPNEEYIQQDTINGVTYCQFMNVLSNTDNMVLGQAFLSAYYI